MKKTRLVFILFLMSCLIPDLSQAQDKKIAMLEPIFISEGINPIVKFMVRGELTKSLTREKGYSAFTRNDVDAIVNEYKFQESGMVDEALRKRLGQLSGVDYVCVSKISMAGDAYYIEASLVHIETGEIDNPGTAFAQGGIQSVNIACQKVAADMVGKTLTISETNNLQPSSQVLNQPEIAQSLSSEYPKVVYNGAYKISILSLSRTGNTLTMYFTVKNDGRYTTQFETIGYNEWEFTLYSEEGDVIKANRTPNYYIRQEFSPNMTIKKKVVFKEVPSDIKAFTHLIFKSRASPDQSTIVLGDITKHAIEGVQIQNM